MFIKKITLLFIILYALSGCKFTQTAPTPTPSPIPTFTPVPPTPLPVHFYQPGNIINFDRNGNGRNFFVTGWSEPEEGFTWTCDKKAELIFQINQEEITCDVMMKVNLEPNISKEKRQRVYIYANSRKVGEWIVSSQGEYKIIIPEVCLLDPLLRITFELPDAFSPKSLGTGEDTRILGIRVIDMVLMEIYRPGEKISFIKGGNGDFYKGQGWSNAEDNFTWTDGKKAEVNIPVGDIRRKLILKVFTGGLFNPGKLEAQRVNIYINGTKIGTWIVKDKMEYTIALPEHSIVNNNINILFDLPDANIPANIGLTGDDGRTLGLCVEYIMLETVQK
ncbi:MAG: hypothetical protein ABRQ37_13380 [Candidatus Eremiobacterota bacterium]